MEYLSLKTRLLIAGGVMGIWVLSVSTAYRYGRQSTELAALQELHTRFAEQVADHNRMIREYDQLAYDYALAQKDREVRITDMEERIHDYLKTIPDDCDIDDRGVQLINDLIGADCATNRAVGLTPVPLAAKPERGNDGRSSSVDQKPGNDVSGLPDQAGVSGKLDSPVPHREDSIGFVEKSDKTH